MYKNLFIKNKSHNNTEIIFEQLNGLFRDEKFDEVIRIALPLMFPKVDLFTSLCGDVH